MRLRHVLDFTIKRSLPPLHFYSYHAFFDKIRLLWYTTIAWNMSNLFQFTSMYEIHVNNFSFYPTVKQILYLTNLLNLDHIIIVSINFMNIVYKFQNFTKHLFFYKTGVAIRNDKYFHFILSSLWRNEKFQVNLEYFFYFQYSISLIVYIP